MAILDGLPVSYHDSKRAKILEVAAAGDKTNKEIATMTDSTPSYVAKVKSEARLDVRHSQRSPTETVRTLPSPRHPRPVIGSSQRPNLKDNAENSEERKKLWKAFADGKPLAIIIQETGLNPHAVEAEYDAFFKFTERDPYTFQKEAMEFVASLVPSIQDQKEKVELYQNLVSEYNKNGSLTNKAFSLLLRLVQNMGFEAGIESVRRTNNRTPKGWIRPNCSVCGKPLSGLVFDPAKMADGIIKSFKGWCHATCGSRKSVRQGTQETNPSFQ